MDDLISRSALLADIEESVVFSVKAGQPSAEIRGANKITDRIKVAPAVDAVEVEAVAQMFYESFGDPYACNFNGNDEWLPMLCDNMNECPDVKDELFCWKQFIKHYGERRGEE